MSIYRYDLTTTSFSCLSLFFFSFLLSQCFITALCMFCLAFCKIYCNHSSFFFFLNKFLISLSPPCYWPSWPHACFSVQQHEVLRSCSSCPLHDLQSLDNVLKVNLQAHALYTKAHCEWKPATLRSPVKALLCKTPDKRVSVGAISESSLRIGGVSV